MTEKEETKPIGVVVTIKEIHEAVGRIEDTLSSKITNLRIRVAAHEVIIVMMTAIIIFLAQKGTG